MTPRRLVFENLDKPKPINLLLPGFGRFRVSSGTRERELYIARRAMVKDLATRLQFELLTAVKSKRFTIAELHVAYRKGASALEALLKAHTGKPIKPLLEQWYKEYRRRDRKRTRRKIELFLDKHGGLAKATTACMTSEAVAAYLADRVDLRTAKGDTPQPASGATLNRDRAAIGVFATWLLRRGQLGKHPIAYKAVEKAEESDPREPAPFTPDEYDGYFTCLYDKRADLIAVFRLLVHTGADAGELETRVVRDVDFVRGRIQFRRSKTKTPSRVVPIDPFVVQELRGHIAAHGLKAGDRLFGMFTRTEIENAHRWAAAAVSRPDLRVKDLRHLAAIAWAQAGVDLVTIQRYMGHATLNQTAIYAKYLPGDARDQDNAARAAEQMRGPEGVISIGAKAQGGGK